MLFNEPDDICIEYCSFREDSDFKVNEMVVAFLANKDFVCVHLLLSPTPPPRPPGTLPPRLRCFVLPFFCRELLHSQQFGMHSHSSITMASCFLRYGQVLECTQHEVTVQTGPRHQVRYERPKVCTCCGQT